MIKYKLNYTFQKVDSRDYKYTLPTKKLLPSIFSLPTPNPTQILDQGPLGSCVSNAIVQCINIQTKYTSLPISRLHLYFYGRCYQGLSNLQDTGLNIRIACSTLSKYGYIQEKIWPYNISNFAILPPYTVPNFLPNYMYVIIGQTFSEMAIYLTSNGPILVGIKVFSSFMKAINGQIPIPNPTEKSIGGHCILLIGYTSTQFIFVNSWGPNWGKSGIGYIPQSYILSNTLTDQPTGLIWTN